MNEIKYRHFRSQFKNKSVAVTVAYQCEKDPAVQGYRIHTVGLAFCSPKDSFCRAIGRYISGGRCGRPGNNGYTANISRGDTVDISRNQIIAELIDRTNGPRWFDEQIKQEIIDVLMRKKYEIDRDNQI